VSEESERVISGPEGNGAGVDPTAVALALAGASRAKADAFLDDQRSLIAVQKHHLHEQLKQVRLGTLSQRLTVGLKLATGLVGFGIIAGVALAVWNASHASGLVVESFAVPPRFAEAGVTGAVLSDDLNSKLGTIRDLSDANSLTRSSDVSANRDDEFRVEIPETGVSLGQAWRYLRLWFGHERRLTGNLRELSDGRIALTATLAGADTFTTTGPATDLDSLEQQAAEHVYQQVDSTNYGQYLGQVNRRAEMVAAAQRGTELAQTDSDRAVTFGYLASVTLTNAGDAALALKRNLIAINYDPKVLPAYSQLANVLLLLGHDEEALQKVAVIPTLREEDQPPLLQGRTFRLVRLAGALARDLETGDFAAAASLDCVDCRGLAVKFRQAEYAARAHDMRQSRTRLDEITTMLQSAGAPAPIARSTTFSSDLIRIGYYQHAALGLWQDAAADARAIAAALDTPNFKNGPVPVSRSWAYPLLAVAEARGGDMAHAHADADAMPVDCYACLRAHGVIDGLERNWTGADGWFARAVAAAPSIPFAYEEWGRALLDRGQPDAAIAKFTIANQKGPHFADPLEGWGEALMAKNQSHLALAKFAEADKYAPNWGRLHLKWVEALVYAGKPVEAKMQFVRAAQLDLTPAEKAELARRP
jgi:tetratricopeptide (TPR) repeat protein